MIGFAVADIQEGGSDSTGARILTVFAKVVPLYAVYRTAERVVVHFADDPDLGGRQRRAMARLNPVRGEINGLIDGWRSSRAHDKQAKARLFDRRAADALVMALQGDPGHADLILQAIKTDLLEERTSWARFQYLLFASGAAAVLIALIAFVTGGWFARALHDFGSTAETLWLAAAAGAIGAFFSIAIAIRSRTVLTDLQTLDNAADAVLRVVIGAIAAALAICLIESGFVTISVGGAGTADPGPESDRAWLLVVIAAFVAGFSERLIPDLLDKSALTGSAAPARSGASAPAGERRPEGHAALTDAPAAAAPEGPAEEEAGDPAPEDEGEDGCVADVTMAEEELVDDTELPPARGGVEELRAA